ncbi:transglycosylase SLT domain-containing protein [Vibrio quintilis]|uniref:Soluble lytic murein transglycosylase n=1 Tax=Vibrio quintilis TaxID=1117707 RepID=A0A1M7YRU3_9VIBR|nr:transglycosylase SLT domain-containing protein [Vibrio quintilis]SHO55236.1 Soluble lytic murein transglycosylase precursor [Vibrio quintilis]
MMSNRFESYLVVLCLILAACCVVVSPAIAGGKLSLEEQRQLYDQAQQWLDNKHVRKYYRVKSRLEAYPLTPYLDYRSILINMAQKPPIVVRNFINSHAEFPFSNRITAPYLEALARHKKWSVLLQFQRTEPRQEKYRCYYYTAKLKTGNKPEAFRGAQSLWLSGKSVTDECNELFSSWEKSEGISEKLVLERMFLAFEQRQYSLMRFLKKKIISDDNQSLAGMLLTTYRHPENVDQFLKHGPLNEQMLRLVGLGLKKLAFQKPALAYQFVQQGKLKYLDSKARTAFFEYLAGILLNEDDIKLSESMKKWRDNVISSSQNTPLLERRIREEIRYGKWSGIYDWVNKLPHSLQSTARWQFWLGLSEIKSGQGASGLDKLEQLSGKRNFYSVAAASYLDQSFAYTEQPLEYNPALIKPYQTSLDRIQELIDRNKTEASKSEWRWLLGRTSPEEQIVLAQYAAAAHWYHLTVVATIEAQLWEHLELRFPKAYLQLFEFFADKYKIDPVTLISLARQESAMDVQAYSPVGAKGLMQLLPSTARYMAKKYQLNYKNSRDLFNAKKNIELGSQYLTELLERYNGNRILAFAAYNAGPSRVDLWLKRSSGNLDVYRFIEAIPFRETRGYVQNILMFETYYRYLLDMEGNFLYPSELELKY